MGQPAGFKMGQSVLKWASLFQNKSACFEMVSVLLTCNLVILNGLPCLNTYMHVGKLATACMLAIVSLMHVHIVSFKMVTIESVFTEKVNRTVDVRR